MNVNPPVTDWVHDFDHTDPQWTEDPYPIWDKLRAASPIVHTDRYLGVYMPTTYEAVREISHDTEHFSSRRIIVRSERPEIVAPAPPITSDPPFHKPAKQLHAAAVHAGCGEEARAALARDLQRADRRPHQGEARRRRRAVRQIHPGARDRPHARHPGNRRRPVHPLDPRDPRARHPRSADVAEGCDRNARVFPGAISRSARRSRPTTSSQ